MTRRPDARFAEMSKALKALADPTRMRILGLLAGGQVCVCHIHAALAIPQPTASRHLAYLRKSGLVDSRREGQWVYYTLAKLSDDTLRTLVNAVTHCVGHVDTVARDRKRLEIATGYCCVVDTTPLTLGCCVPSPERS
jgi:ArsR family transcriptional regulator, arsenate/arsenite/antimonite-responsive transcriptional repressor